jgi:hypothetical protein
MEDENRALLVQAGAVPVLVALLLSPDPDIQYYCTTAISNIAVDPLNRERLAQTERGLVSGLVKLMSGESELVAGQAALASRNLASDGNTPLANPNPQPPPLFTYFPSKITSFRVPKCVPLLMMVG